MLLTRRQLAALVSTPIPPATQRRSCGRVATTIDVIARRINGGFVGAELVMTVTDISTAGLGLVSPEAIVCGEELLVRFPVPAEDPMVIRAIARWCRSKGNFYQIGAENLSVLPLDIQADSLAPGEPQVYKSHLNVIERDV